MTFGKVDRKEEISPREFGKHINFLVSHCSIWQDRGPRHSAPRRAKHAVLHSAKLRVLREVEKAVSEGAYRSKY